MKTYCMWVYGGNKRSAAETVRALVTKTFRGLPARADRLKIFALNLKVAERLERARYNL